MSISGVNSKGYKGLGGSRTLGNNAKYQGTSPKTLRIFLRQPISNAFLKGGPVPFRASNMSAAFE